MNSMGKCAVDKVLKRISADDHNSAAQYTLEVLQQNPELHGKLRVPGRRPGRPLGSKVSRRNRSLFTRLQYFMLVTGFSLLMT